LSQIFSSANPKEMDDYRYTYAVARINVLSTKLLDREFASRMLASEPDEIIRMLGETVYAENLAGAEGPSQIEKNLLRELGKTHDLLETICPDKGLVRLFRERYDYGNLKAILKSQITGVPYEDSVTELGTYKADELSEAIRERKYRFIPDHLRDAALDAMAAYEESGRLEAIGCSCDKSMWSYLMQKARKSRNRVVISLFREYINLTNIKTFFRVKEFVEDTSAFKRYFIAGGDYTLDFFLRHMGEELGLFLAQLAKTRYEQDIVSHGLRLWPEDKSFWQLEVACDNFILEWFWKMRMQLFSIAPVIYYLLRKTAEIELIKTIMRCKRVGMPRHQMEERLRYVYV